MNDAKYLIAQKLSGKDLLSLCSTDTEFRGLCMSNKFNPIWQANLKKEYNVDYKGKNAYMEYLHHSYFSKQIYYTVVISRKLISFKNPSLNN